MTEATDLLVLHAVRLLGAGPTGAVAARFGLDPVDVEELLLDAEALGQVARSAFGGPQVWSLTERGRARGEALLADDLDRRGARTAVEEVHDAFAPLNARAQGAFTRWQVRPLPGDPLAANDHDDHAWDDRVLDDLRGLGFRWEPLGERLAGVLPRCAGYGARYGSALRRADAGEHRWVDGVGIDSCHRVWMQLHEDLLATLGLARG